MVVVLGAYVAGGRILCLLGPPLVFWNAISFDGAVMLSSIEILDHCIDSLAPSLEVMLVFC